MTLNSKRGKKRLSMLFILCIVLTLSACGASDSKVNPKVEISSEETLELEVPTPTEEMDLVRARVMEEMRVFDVNVHHEAIYSEIENLPESLDSEELKSKINEAVSSYMDEYFKEVIGNILLEYNDKYMAEDVETIFETTSRSALYELIVLYEHTFYENNR